MHLEQSNVFSMTKDDFFYSFRAQTAQTTHAIFLESGRFGQQSIAAWDPLAVVQSTAAGIHIAWRDGNEEFRTGEPLALTEALVNDYHIIAPHDRFYGGALGFITYDYVRRIEKLPMLAIDDVSVPDTYFYIVDCWTVFDVQKNEAQVMKLSTSTIDLNEAALRWQQTTHTRKFEETTARAVETDDRRLKSMSETQFHDAVLRIQQYIACGDVFQVNLSVRQEEALTAMYC